MLTGRAGMKVVGLWKVEICYVKKKMDGERLLPADAGRKVMVAEELLPRSRCLFIG